MPYNTSVLAGLILRAAELESAGKWNAEAIGVNSRILELPVDPKRPKARLWAYSRLAKCYATMGDCEAAQVACQKASECALQDPEAASVRADAEAAIRKIRTARSVSGMTAQEAFAVGVDARRKGATELAIFALSHAVRLCPDQHYVVALGAAYRQAGQMAKAERLYRQVLGEGFSRAAAVCLAAVLRETGRLQDAHHWLQKALQADPNDPFALNALGAVLCDMGALQDAEGCFARANELGAPQRQLLSELRAAYLARGDHAGIRRVDELTATSPTTR